MKQTLIIGAPLQPSLNVDISEKNSNVLIIDDNEGWCEILSRAFSEIAPYVKLNFIHSSKKILEAINVKCEILPDIIILDIHMPGISGFECLDEIRSNNRLKDIAVVMHSSSVYSSEIDTAYSKGADLYLPKPDSYPELKRVLTWMLGIDFSESARLARKNFVAGTLD